MWSCGFRNRHPVELVFHLPGTEISSSESHGLSKITVWNYNRGIKVSGVEYHHRVLFGQPEAYSSDDSWKL